jgi:hypothetical protein
LLSIREWNEPVARSRWRRKAPVDNTPGTTNVAAARAAPAPPRLSADRRRSRSQCTENFLYHKERPQRNETTPSSWFRARAACCCWRQRPGGRRRRRGRRSRVGAFEHLRRVEKRLGRQVREGVVPLQQIATVRRRRMLSLHFLHTLGGIVEERCGGVIQCVPLQGRHASCTAGTPTLRSSASSRHPQSRP